MWDYEQRQDTERNKELSYVITRARLAIESDNVEKGLTGQYESKTNNLNLAANYGYSQKTEISTSFKDETVDPEALEMVKELAHQISQGQVKQLTQGKTEQD